MMRRMRRVSVVAALLMAACASALPAHAAPPAVLEQVPADAQFVVVVKNLRSFSDNLSNAGLRLNLPVPPDPLQTYAKNIGITDGLDAKGSLAFVHIATPAGEKGKRNAEMEMPYILLIPTTDAKKMLEPFKPTAPENGISAITMPNAGDDSGFATVVGNYVAVAQERAALDAYVHRAGSITPSMPKEALDAFEKNDVVFYANVPQVSKQWTTEVDNFVKMAGAMSQRGAKSVPLQTAIFKMYADGFKSVLSDSDAGLLTLRLDPENGATLGAMGHFKADSYMAKLAAAQQPIPAVPQSGAAGVNTYPLKGLPGGNYLAAGHMTWNPASVMDLVNKVSTRLLADPELTKGANPAELQRAVDNVKQTVMLESGVSYAVYEPAIISDGFLNMVLLFDSTNPEKLRDLTLQQYKDNVIMGMSVTGTEISPEVTVPPTPTDIKGVKVYTATVKFSSSVETPSAESRAMLEQFKTMYGPEGMRVSLAAVNKRFLTVISNDTNLVNDAVEAAKADTAKLTDLPEIAKVQKQVVPNPVSVAYLPVDRWIALAMRQFMGGGGPAPAGGGLAVGGAPSPLVVSAGVGTQMSVVELHIPMSAAISVTNTVRPFFPGL